MEEPLSAAEAERMRRMAAQVLRNLPALAETARVARTEQARRDAAAVATVAKALEPTLSGLQQGLVAYGRWVNRHRDELQQIMGGLGAVQETMVRKIQENPGLAENLARAARAQAVSAGQKPTRAPKPIEPVDAVVDIDDDMAQTVEALATDEDFNTLVAETAAELADTDTARPPDEWIESELPMEAWWLIISVLVALRALQGLIEHPQIATLLGDVGLSAQLGLAIYSQGISRRGDR